MKDKPILSALCHYDRLIDLDNDPFWDEGALREYMDGWDGDAFIRFVSGAKRGRALEIGVGTGRMAARTAKYFERLAGIDISEKSVARARKNLEYIGNIELICGDFLAHSFSERFDCIYSTLTFMHIEDKARAVEKAAALLMPGGIFVLSLDKGRDEWIDMGKWKTRVFPDDPVRMKTLMETNGLIVKEIFETERAYILTGVMEAPFNFQNRYAV
ncbi:MAG: class I SAM-dependent methyltransferase [Clostridia bacterium]|nr:class I SAM-dependent methyltransferase [Clostridia bacterium]